MELEPLEWSLIIFLVLFVGIVGIAMQATARTEANCLALGWPSGKVTTGLVAYCVKRVNQTDEVILLEELRGRSDGRP